MWVSRPLYCLYIYVQYCGRSSAAQSNRDRGTESGSQGRGQWLSEKTQGRWQEACHLDQRLNSENETWRATKIPKHSVIDNVLLIKKNPLFFSFGSVMWKITQQGLLLYSYHTAINTSAAGATTIQRFYHSISIHPSIYFTCLILSQASQDHSI